MTRSRQKPGENINGLGMMFSEFVSGSRVDSQQMAYCKVSTCSVIDILSMSFLKESLNSRGLFMFDDGLREECGVFGVIGSDTAARDAYFGLYALQHRGQEAAGIATTDGHNIFTYKHLGLVGDVFNDNAIFDDLPGRTAIAHNRYSTTGGTSIANAQPLTVTFGQGWMSAAHNGNLINAATLREKMEAAGSIFSTTSDSEVILHLIAKSKADTFEDRIVDALSKVKGAYSLLFINDGALYAIRDPYGIRPLCIGRKGDTWAVASESCAFDILEIKYERTVLPGEFIVMREGQEPQSFFPFEKPPRYAGCVFEFIYFSRPDSFVFGKPVDLVRRKMGRQLAVEAPVHDADAVIAVPDSSNTAALGYANTLGKPFELGLIRNHYIGRTFIRPRQGERDISARIKYNPVPGILRDKKIVIVDDSIVRGTTSKKLIKMIRDAGAKEIHFRVASPPIISSCFYGVDTPEREKLIASTKTVEQIREYLGVDSLAYLSLEGMRGIPELHEIGLCNACFTGNYPVT